MELLDSLRVGRNKERAIELCRGDLTALGPEDAVDVLVVSAFPNHYAPSPGTLIGALDRKGISVGRLARDKEADLRQTHCCWISREIQTRPPGIQFQRILCFEPRFAERAPERVGDIFRCLATCLSYDPPVTRVAMPLVACGMQGEAVAEMVPPLLDAAAHWMSTELPLQCLKVVAYRPKDAAEANRAFASLKQKYADGWLLAPSAHHKYDVFISYAHHDERHARAVVDELRRLRPALRIFCDRMSIQPGAAWQQTIYEAIEGSRLFMALYSPQYLASKVCLEEFHLAKFCNRESGLTALLPLYLSSTQLPAFMRMLNYVDCREADPAKLRGACGQALALLDGL
jgi:hypothetical protein